MNKPLPENLRTKLPIVLSEMISTDITFDFDDKLSEDDINSRVSRFTATFESKVENPEELQSKIKQIISEALL